MSKANQKRKNQQKIDKFGGVWGQVKCVLIKSWAAAYSLNASPVISGPASRCFFDRASAPSGEVDLEREEILADALKLKHLASAYAKTAPSLTADPTATARCYFERASKEVSERSERALMKTRIRASEQQTKRAASEASSKRSELVATSVGAVLLARFAHRASRN